MFKIVSGEIMDKIEKRDKIRSVDPHNPEITQLNNDIAADITENKRRIWRQTVDSIDRGSDPKKLWRVVRSLNGKRKFLLPNQPISFGSSTFSDRKAIANKFIRQYTPPPRSNKKIQGCPSSVTQKISS
jgi:hypothetical protein